MEDLTSVYDLNHQCNISKCKNNDYHMTETNLKSIISPNEIKAALLVHRHLETLWGGQLLEPLGGRPQVERQSSGGMPFCHPARKSDSVFCFPELYERGDIIREVVARLYSSHGTTEKRITTGGCMSNKPKQ